MEPSRHLAEQAPAHLLPPTLPILDDGDAVMRIRNYRRSYKACPSGSQAYFEVLIVVMEREVR